MTDKRLDRWFTILKVVLFCMPFLYLGYVGLGTGGIDAKNVLESQPTMAISFLSAMLQPYAAWILILSRRRLEDGREAAAVLNLSVLLAAELLTMNTVGVVGFALVLWGSCKRTGLNPLTALRGVGPGRRFYEAGGSILVLLLAGLCFFASMQVRAL